MSGKLTVEQDSQAATLLAMARADPAIGATSQTYLALQSTGPQIDGTTSPVVDYSIALEWPIYVIKSPSRTDKSDVYAGEFDFEVSNDATIGVMTSVINSQVLAM